MFLLPKFFFIFITWFLVIPTCQAGFAQLSPPPSFTQSAGQVFVKAAANDAFVGNVVRSSTIVNVGGRAITVPVASRLAANASTIAATQVFRKPAILLGLGAAAIATFYYQYGFSPPTSNIPNWTKSDPKACTVGPCYEYSLRTNPETWTRSFDEAAALNMQFISSPPSLIYYIVSSDGFANYIYSRTYNGVKDIGDLPGSLQSWPKRQYNPTPALPVPVTETDFVTRFKDLPIPEGLPQLLPEPLPVGEPIVNPNPELNPEPLRVPTGNPVPVPNTNPKQYKKPVIDIVPSPVPGDPWRIDIQPREIITEDPNPIPLPHSVPAPDSATTVDTAPDLCEKNPDILACSKVDDPKVKFDTLDTPTADSIFKPFTDIAAPFVNFQFNAPAGACPKPTFQVFGASLAMTQHCDIFEQLRGTIQTVMSAVFLIAAFVIVFTA